MASLFSKVFQFLKRLGKTDNKVNDDRVKVKVVEFPIHGAPGRPLDENSVGVEKKESIDSKEEVEEENDSLKVCNDDANHNDKLATSENLVYHDDGINDDTEINGVLRKIEIDSDNGDYYQVEPLSGVEGNNDKDATVLVEKSKDNQVATVFDEDGNDNQVTFNLDEDANDNQVKTVLDEDGNDNKVAIKLDEDGNDNQVVISLDEDGNDNQMPNVLEDECNDKQTANVLDEDGNDNQVATVLDEEIIAHQGIRLPDEEIIEDQVITVSDEEVIADQVITVSDEEVIADQVITLSDEEVIADQVITVSDEEVIADEVIKVIDEELIKDQVMTVSDEEVIVYQDVKLSDEKSNCLKTVDAVEFNDDLIATDEVAEKKDVDDLPKCNDHIATDITGIEGQGPLGEKSGIGESESEVWQKYGRKIDEIFDYIKRSEKTPQSESEALLRSEEGSRKQGEPGVAQTMGHTILIAGNTISGSGNDPMTSGKNSSNDSVNNSDGGLSLNLTICPNANTNQNIATNPFIGSMPVAGPECEVRNGPLYNQQAINQVILPPLTSTILESDYNPTCSEDKDNQTSSLDTSDDGLDAYLSFDDTISERGIDPSKRSPSNILDKDAKDKSNLHCTVVCLGAKLAAEKRTSDRVIGIIDMSPSMETSLKITSKDGHVVDVTLLEVVKNAIKENMAERKIGLMTFNDEIVIHCKEKQLSVDTDQLRNEYLQVVREKLDVDQWYTTNKEILKDILHGAKAEKASKFEDSQEDIIRAEPNIVQPEEDSIRAEPNMVKPEEDSIRAEPNKVKPEEDSIRAKPNMVKSEEDSNRAEPNMVKPEEDLNRAEPNMVKPEEDSNREETNMVKPEEDSIKAEPIMVKPEEDSIRAKPNMVKPEEDSIKAEPIMVKPEEDSKMVKNEKDWNIMLSAIRVALGTEQGENGSMILVFTNKVRQKLTEEMQKRGEDVLKEINKLALSKQQTIAIISFEPCPLTEMDKSGKENSKSFLTKNLCISSQTDVLTHLIERVVTVMNPVNTGRNNLQLLRKSYAQLLLEAPPVTIAEEYLETVLIKQCVEDLYSNFGFEFKNTPNSSEKLEQVQFSMNLALFVYETVENPLRNVIEKLEIAIEDLGSNREKVCDLCVTARKSLNTSLNAQETIKESLDELRRLLGIMEGNNSDFGTSINRICETNENVF